MSTKVAICNPLCREGDTPGNTTIFVFENGFVYETMIFTDDFTKVSDNRYQTIYDGVLYQITVLAEHTDVLDTEYISDQIPVHEIPKCSAIEATDSTFQVGDEVFKPAITVDGKMIGKFIEGAREGQIGLLSI